MKLVIYTPDKVFSKTYTNKKIAIDELDEEFMKLELYKLQEGEEKLYKVFVISKKNVSGYQYEYNHRKKICKFQLFLNKFLPFFDESEKKTKEDDEDELQQS